MEKWNQKVKFLDVGHGDSSVIYLSEGLSSIVHNVVIIDIVDADKLLNELKNYNVKVVDLIIISHSDADHCRGVNDFLEKFLNVGIVKAVCFNLDKRKPTKTMALFLKKFLEIYKKHNINLMSGTIDSSGNTKELISNTYSRLVLLYPNMAEITEAYLQNNINNHSIVCLLENDICNILFSGDLEESGWTNLLTRIHSLKCNVLKMPHHGALYNKSKGAGLKDILKVLKPEIAIVSSGNNNNYKHPEQHTIELLKKRKIKIFCTEFTSLCHCNVNDFGKKCYGDIEVITDKTEYVIKSETNNLSFLKHAACNL